ncbi:MAG: asparagine--tRNA ligase [Spirochaetota bacterium]
MAYVEMQLTDLEKYADQEVQLRGWLHGKRGSNKLQFLQVRNSGKIIQVVAAKEDLGEESFAIIKALQQEVSLLLRGELQASEKSPLGYEIILTEFEVLGRSGDYPITPKEHGVDFLHNNRHLWLRSKKQLAILKVRNELSHAIRKFFYENEYSLVDTPILTGSVGESAGTLFETEYFDLGKAYLAQTGQLYLESAIFAHNRVYCFGPTFRAEKSKTRRHLTEFWMVEAETAFMGNEENIALQEKLVKAVIAETIAKAKDSLEVLQRDISALQGFLEKPFAKISYTEAIRILQEQGENIEWGEDINADRENIITSHLEAAVFIKNYPSVIKAFYMKRNMEEDGTVLCADLIAPEGVGEVIGGSEREEDYSLIEKKLKEEGLPVDTYSWYMDLRKYGSVPHSGFGLGLERLVAWVCGLPHVRECIPFPRLMGRLEP